MVPNLQPFSMILYDRMPKILSKEIGYTRICSKCAPKILFVAEKHFEKNLSTNELKDTSKKIESYLSCAYDAHDGEYKIYKIYSNMFIALRTAHACLVSYDDKLKLSKY